MRDAGSDFMVDCIRNLGYEYVAAMPGSTFRGLQESVISYADNKNPEWITCLHEEISAAMAHGYFKACGKPMAIMVHNIVGLQHASMGIYQAWCDRVPMGVFLGNYADATQRNGSLEWWHGAQDVPAMMRGAIKYDDAPASLQHFAESLERGHSLAMTPPYGPYIIVADQVLQEGTRSGNPMMRPYVPVSPPAADANAIAQIAKMLVAAKNPVIVVDRAARTPAGVPLLVELAELLQAPVIDRLARMNFPTNHHLWQQLPVIAEADLVLALDVGDLFNTLGDVADTPHRETTWRIKPGTKVISIDSELLASSANYQDKMRFYQADLPVGGDSEASLPSLIEAVKRAMTTARRNENPQREARWREAFQTRREGDLRAAAIAWDASPISIARLCMEVWNQIKHEEWALVSQATFQAFWQQRLWDFTKHSQYLGHQGAAGVGYTGPAAVGAALAHRSDGTICVNIQGDGDFMVLPGAQWTAAHHKLPLLTLMHNNRAYHQETMYIQKMAGRRDRHPERGRIGTEITNPNIDYAKIAQGLGVYAEGPITSPADLGPAIARALKVVKSGHPALLDVVTQPR
ncbi:MAG TPA: thiamine pyrophosphate-dependent enzyme [Candidatus Limnocylindria bacterium]|nr:thiamine pyrophosphate-dependent enzyme [Candidatus Limnocylindria bacterium]